MPAPVKFSDFYSAEEFAKCSENKRLQKTEDREETYRAEAIKNRQAVKIFLLSLRTEGRLKQCDFEPKRFHYDANAWNLFLAGGEIPESIVGDLAMVISLRQLYRDDVATNYVNLCRLFDEGNFASPNYMNENYVAEVTGEKLILNFANWELKLGLRVLTNKGIILQPFDAPVPDPSKIVIEIPAPSGKLVCVDWPRIEGLENLKKSKRNYNYSLNQITGRLRYTKEMAGLGLAHFHVSNTCPTIYKDAQGRLIVGRRNADESKRKLKETELEDCGMVITDLWWVTIVDEEVLIDLLAKEIGHEKAATAYQDWKNSDWGGGVSMIEVPKGKMFLHVDNQEVGLQEFSSSDFDSNGFEMIYGVVASSEMPFVYKSNAKLLEAEKENKRVKRQKKVP